MALLDQNGGDWKRSSHAEKQRMISNQGSNFPSRSSVLLVTSYICAVTMETGEDAHIAICIIKSLTLPIRALHEGGPAIDAG
jgi:hypothetical protein